MATRVLVPRTIGGGLPRIDGALKVSGGAKYASDYHLPGMLYAVPVCATIANGKITALDNRRRKGAGCSCGVSPNIGWLYRTAPSEGLSGYLDERRPPFEDDAIQYYGSM